MKNLILIKVCCLAVMISEKAKNGMMAENPTLSSASSLHPVSKTDFLSASQVELLHK